MNTSDNMEHRNSRFGFIRLLCILFLTLTSGCTVTHKGYEKEIYINDNTAIHYGENTDELIPNQIAEFMKENGYIDSKFQLQIYMNVENNRYTLKFVNDESVLKNKELMFSFNALEIRLNSNLKLDKAVYIEFTNKDLTKTFDLPRDRSIVNKNAEDVFKLNIYKTDDFHSILYNDSMPISNVKMVDEAVRRLKNYFPNNKKISIIFINNGPDYTVKLFVLKKFWNDPYSLKSSKGVIQYFKDSGIEKSINLMFVDFETFEEIKI